VTRAEALGRDWFRETFEGFVARSDVTLAAFGWSIVDSSTGRADRFRWPPSSQSVSKTPAPDQPG